MEQLTWLQQSLQKPRLSAVARAFAEVFPRPDVPRVAISINDMANGTYNSASKLAPNHLEYPGFILRYREMVAGGNYVGYGWAGPNAAPTARRGGGGGPPGAVSAGPAADSSAHARHAGVLRGNARRTDCGVPVGHSADFGGEWLFCFLW